MPTTTALSTSGQGGYLLPAGYLSTSGSQIVDANGNPVRIDSIGWNGPNGAVGGTFEGLSATSFQTILNSIKADGFNTVRIPWSDVGLLAMPASGSIDYTQNPSLQGLNTLQIFQAVVAYAGQIGVKIIFDHHTNDGGPNGWGGQQTNGLWFDSGPGSDGTDGSGTTGTVTAAKFEQDSVALATTFAGNSTVVGFDLDNEPSSSGNINWGQGGPTDIQAMYTTVGNAVQAVDPGALIIAEGPQEYSTPSSNSGLSSAVQAPEGDLTGVATDPVRLAIVNKIVYSVHEYPSTISDISADSGTAYIQQMNAAWGFLVSQHIAPVWIGEMGASLDGTAESAGSGLADEQAWATTLLNYMNGKDGGQGGPTFSGNQQAISGSWWLVGDEAGQSPNGIQSAWGNGNYRSAQQAITDQMLFIPKTTTTPTPTPTASPNDTIVKVGAAAAIVDAGGNSWTITSGGQVAINGTNDATTANVVELAYVNGTIWQENTSLLWWGESSPSAGWVPSAGTSTSPLPTSSTATTALVLQVSEDAYQGDAAYTIAVNGVQVGGTGTATASHALGLNTPVTLTGSYGADPTVVVTFINDAYGGAGKDRNLYVNSITYSGIAQTASASLYSDGSAAFALHGPVMVTSIPKATLLLADDTGATASLPAITGGTLASIGGAQIALDGNVRQIVDSTGVVNVSTDKSGSGIVSVKMQDLGGASYHFSNFLSTNATLGGASTHSMATAGSLTIDGSAGGDVQLGSGNYNIVIATEASPGGSAAQNQLNITLGGTGNENELHVDDSGTHGVSTNTIHAGSGVDHMWFIGAAATTVYGGSDNVTVICNSGTNNFIAGTGTMVVAGGPGMDSFTFHAGDGLLKIYDFSRLNGDTLTVDKALGGATTEASDGSGGLMISFGSAGHGVDLGGVSSLPLNQIHFA